MTERDSERKEQKPPDAPDQAAKQAEKNATQKLLDDTQLSNYFSGTDSARTNDLTGINSTAAGRVFYVTGEGLAKAPQGIWKSVVHQFEHPGEFAQVAATGALFGVGMRLLLPKAGAAKALVGTAMTYFMVRDAAMPIVGGWQDAASAKNMDDLHGASTKMGDGLGHFTVHTGIAVSTGMMAEGVTGALLNRSAAGRRFEIAKDRFWNSEETTVGSFFKWSERTADRTSEAIADRLIERRRRWADELTLEQKIEAIREANRHAVAHENGTVSVPIGPNGDRLNLGETLGHRKRYRSEQFSERIDALLQAAGDRSPEAVAARPQVPEIQRLRAADNGPAAEVPGGGTPAGEAPTAGKPTGETTGGATEAPKTPGEAGGKTGGTQDGGIIIITDAASGKPPAPQPKRVGDMNQYNVGDMAVAMREASGRVTKETIVVRQATEDIAGPISSTMRSGQAPLDPAHFRNSEMLLAINDQIHTADEYRAAGMLLDHFRTATNQIEIAARGRKGGLEQITDLNQYSRSVHAQLLSRMDELGIPRDVIRGPNSPLFTIRDSDGAGPYTIPAIRDANGKLVTDAAVVTYPREYMGMEGVHTAGVYPHELGHDLIYGDLLRFPQNVRETILTDKVIGDAMKANGIVDVEIVVPGAPGGKMMKSEFMLSVLKAQANENTADMFGQSIDPNTGLSLAVLLASLRKPGGKNPSGPGMLETRSMYGKEMIDADMHNTLGIEPHGLDRWRLKLTAETMRKLGGESKEVLDAAKKLDSLADSMSRPGDQYIWASMDHEGGFVSLPMREWDAVIPHLVEAQFTRKLDALNGHTLAELAPNYAERFHRVETLAEAMANAAVKGERAIPTFNKGEYRIEEVFSAGLSGWMKAVQKNADAGGQVSAETLMARVNKLSEVLRAQYRNDVPETILASGAKQPLAQAITQAAFVKPFTMVARKTGELAEVQPRIRERFAHWAPGIAGYAGTEFMGPRFQDTLRDLMEHKAVEQKMLNDAEQRR